MKSQIFYISLIINLLFIGLGIFSYFRMGGWKNIWSKINNRGIDKMYLHRQNLFELLPARDSGIVFLGDSITEQCEWSEILENEKVINRGIAGDHCDGIRERLDEIARLNPSRIYLMAGVNDLVFHAPIVVLEKYKKLVASIQDKMPGTSLYIQSVLPVNNNVNPTPVENNSIQQLNQGIENFAENENLTFINLYPKMLGPSGNLHPDYTLDGIHLNGLAYKKWKEVIMVSGQW